MWWVDGASAAHAVFVVEDVLLVVRDSMPQCGHVQLLCSASSLSGFMTYRGGLDSTGPHCHTAWVCVQAADNRTAVVVLRALA